MKQLTRSCHIHKKIHEKVCSDSGRRRWKKDGEYATPKQFLLLNDKPVLYYTVKAFLEAYDDLHLILVLPEEYIDMGKEIIDAYFEYDRIHY
jgi:2-C-methyl-D-erythritol 4-phosphate cytidylyltransferase